MDDEVLLPLPAHADGRMLGKDLPRHDARTLEFAAYVTGDLDAPPTAHNWGRAIAPTAWGMMGNDRLADCTCAAAGHMILCWTANAGPAMAAIAEDDVITAYSAVSGYNPATGANNRPVQVLDVLAYWRKTGVAGNRLGAFAALEPGNREHIRAAVAIFGGCYIGFHLPLSAQQQRVWAVPPGGATGAGQPGSWGGHAVSLVGYDTHGLTVITWGAPKRLTWAFLDHYCDEAFVLIDHAFLTGDRKTPDGFDLESLRRDLAALRSQPGSAGTPAK